VKSAVSVVLGTASFFSEGGGSTTGTGTGYRVVIQQIIDDFKAHGHNELDTARIYGSGTSEVILAELDWQKQGLVVDTKIRSFIPGIHAPEKIHASVQESLDALKTDKVRILYLHGPDRQTPIEDVLVAVNEEYKKGRFEQFGLSNYSPEEVEQIVKISKEKGYVLPTVYQGLYNLLVRKGEKEFFPLLRKHHIKFFAYSPLAGGFLSEEISQARFDTSSIVGKMYHDRFINDDNKKAVEILAESAHKHGLTISEVALRWLAHHSQLKREYGDAIIIGGRRPAAIHSVLDDLDKPALPADVLATIDKVWELVEATSAEFHN